VQAFLDKKRFSLGAVEKHARTVHSAKIAEMNPFNVFLKEFIA
jgi:hypothetical protein